MPKDVNKSPSPSSSRAHLRGGGVQRSVDIHADSVLSLRLRIERLRHALSTQGGRILKVACAPGSGEKLRTACVSYSLPARFSGQRMPPGEHR